MRPRAPSFKWECFSAGNCCLHPAPSPVCGGGRQGGNGLKRAYFPDPTPRIQMSCLFMQRALGAFPAASLAAGWAARRAMPRSADGRAFGLEDPASYLEE